MADLKYPKSRDGDADYILFSHHKYRSNNTLRREAPTAGDPPSENNRISLFMPPTIPGVGQSQNYNGSGTKFAGPFGQIKKDLIEQTVGINKPYGSFKELGDQYLNMGTAGDLATQVGAVAVGSLLGTTPNEALAFARGQVFNPNIEMLYDGPNLRAFEFTFVLVPFNQEDTNIINQIIKEFKMYSAPNLEGNGSFMEIPHLWNIIYKTGGGSTNKFLNRFKNCVLENLNVTENAGQSSYSTFKDGAPTQTEIALRFLETDIVTRKDHEDATTLRGF